MSDAPARIPEHPYRDPERLLALHDELDALYKEKSSTGATVVFGFAAVLYFLLGLDMGSWPLLLGSTLSGVVAAVFALRDVRRSLRKRALHEELAARSARELSSG